MFTLVVDVCLRVCCFNTFCEVLIVVLGCLLLVCGLWFYMGLTVVEYLD